MELARTFVSFSGTDIQRYHMMCAWKAHEHIEFNFADFQLDEAVNSNNPYYIKSKCAAKIRRADTFVLLIGTDTYIKTQFVEPEVEAAIEKGCRLIGVNLNNCRFKDWLCPSFFADKGALFVPFSSRILAEALKWNRGTPTLGSTDDWYFYDWVYTNLGYTLVGNTAVLPPAPNPLLAGTGLRGRNESGPEFSDGIRSLHRSRVRGQQSSRDPLPKHCAVASKRCGTTSSS
jgi:hypothetical protein